MCIEDIRMGRKTWFRQTQTVVAPVGFVVVPADAKRVGITVERTSGTATVLHAGSDLNTFRFAIIYHSFPNPMLRVEQWGQLITGAITVLDSAAGGFTVTITELFMDEE